MARAAVGVREIQACRLRSLDGMRDCGKERSSLGRAAGDILLSPFSVIFLGRLYVGILSPVSTEAAQEQNFSSLMGIINRFADAEEAFLGPFY